LSGACADLAADSIVLLDGSATVYDVKGPDGVAEWTDTYAISWGSDRCYYRPGHPHRSQINPAEGHGDGGRP